MKLINAILVVLSVALLTLIVCLAVVKSNTVKSGSTGTVMIVSDDQTVDNSQLQPAATYREIKNANPNATVKVTE